MKIEYLILAPNHDSFCNSKSAFIDFLKVDSHIEIKGNKISYSRERDRKILVECLLRVDTDLIESKSERYFMVVLEADNKIDVDDFFALGEKVKAIALRINPAQTKVNTIWDDVGRHYAEAAYPFINEIENLMRKLISKFMLINAGMNWTKDAIHPELFSKIEGFSDEDLYSNDIYKLDFIHLSDVLFKKKRDLTFDGLERLLSTTKFDAVDQEVILKFIPRSNWEKYFSKLLGESGEKLAIKWKRLYKLRNKVAHNRFLIKAEYSEVVGVSGEVKTHLLDAISKLGEIDLDDADRELLAQSYQPQTSETASFSIGQAIYKHLLEDGFEDCNVESSGGFDFILREGDEKVGVFLAVPDMNRIYQYTKKVVGIGGSTRRSLMGEVDAGVVERVLVFLCIDEKIGLDESTTDKLLALLDELHDNMRIRVCAYTEDDAGDIHYSF